jgi:hypothetical protein
MASMQVGEPIYSQFKQTSPATDYLRRVPGWQQLPEAKACLRALRGQPPHGKHSSIKLDFRELAGVPQGCGHVPVCALHPDLVVLGGGVMGLGALLIDTVRATVRNRVRMFPADNVLIERSVLDDKAGLYGGIALALQGGVL